MSNQLCNISEDFSFSYGNQSLFEVDKNYGNIFIEKGKIYGIYGENGSGKTTLLNLINTFTLPTQGEIKYYFNGLKYVHSYNNKKENRSNIIANNIRRSFQVPQLIDELSAYENILISKRDPILENFGKSFEKLKNDRPNQEISELLQNTGFTGDEIVETLSYGQRKILSNLQMLFSGASLLILDEPFANLHYNIIQILKIEFLKKKNDNKTTIIIVEHTQENLRNFADEIIQIREKKIFIQKNNA